MLPWLGYSPKLDGCLRPNAHAYTHVAEIERDFNSSRTKEALAKRKAEGMKLGRPVGGAKNFKRDKHADKIDGYLAKGINKVAIAKLLDVSPNTLYEWLKVRRPGSAPAP